MLTKKDILKVALLAVVLFVFIAGLYGCQKGATTDEGFTYKIDFAYVESDIEGGGSSPGRGVRIVGYSGGATDIVVPETIGGEAVRWIDPSAFAGNTNIISLVVPSKVKILFEGSFKDCSSLKTVKLPEGLRSIQSKAFYGCTALTSIDIPEKVQEINDDAFTNCTSLSRVTLSPYTQNWVYLAKAFRGCTSLKAPTGNDGLDLVLPLLETFEEYPAGSERSTKASMLIFKEGYYPYLEVMFGPNPNKVYTETWAGNWWNYGDPAVTMPSDFSDILGPPIPLSEYTPEGNLPLGVHSGSDSTGKILILEEWIYEAHGEAPAGVSYSIDFGRMQNLPKDEIAFELDSVEYVIYMRTAEGKGGVVEVYRFETAVNSYSLLTSIPVASPADTDSFGANLATVVSAAYDYIVSQK
jgi:hypothetical protein